MPDLHHIKSPLGILEIEADESHLLAIRFRAGTSESSNPIIKQCIRELEEYFTGKRIYFDVPIAPVGTPFQLRVWEQLQAIPFAKSISYSELANLLNDPKCIRAAATANGRNPIPIIIPCHRVIGKDGSLVGFSGGLDKKKWLLQHEGIICEQKEIFA